MLIYRKNQNARVPVVLKDLSGSAVNGVAAASVSFSVLRENNSATDLSLNSTTWAQVTATAWSSQGYYNVVITGSQLSVTGVFQYCASVTNCAPYFGVIHVFESTERDVLDILGTPNYGTIALDIANVSGGGGGGLTTVQNGMLTATYTATLGLPAFTSSATGFLTATYTATLGIPNLSSALSPRIPTSGVIATFGDVTASRDLITGSILVNRGYLTATYTATLGVPNLSSALSPRIPPAGIIAVQNDFSGSFGSGLSAVQNGMLTATLTATLDIQTKIGTPGSTIAGDISSVGSSLSGISANAASAASNSSAAASSAATAATQATSANSNTTTLITNVSAVNTKLGTPKSGSIAADIHDTRDNVSGGGGGGGSTDLGLVLKKIGTPSLTLADDLKQVGKIVQDIQKKVS